MFQRKTTLLITISIYLLLSALLFILQPSLMFDNNGDIKQFGFESDESLVPLILILPLMAVLIYFLVLVFEMIMT